MSYSAENRSSGNSETPLARVVAKRRVPLRRVRIHLRCRVTSGIRRTYPLLSFRSATITILARLLRKLDDGHDLLFHEAVGCPVLSEPDLYGLHRDEDCESAADAEAVQRFHEQANHRTVYAYYCREDPCIELDIIP